jgi:hypothetical protein
MDRRQPDFPDRTSCLRVQQKFASAVLPTYMHGHQEQGRIDHRAVTYTQDAGDAGTQVTHGVARRGRPWRCWTADGHDAAGMAKRGGHGVAPMRFDGATNVVKIHLISLTDRSHKSVQ